MVRSLVEVSARFPVAELAPPSPTGCEVTTVADVGWTAGASEVVRVGTEAEVTVGTAAQTVLAGPYEVL